MLNAQHPDLTVEPGLVYLAVNFESVMTHITKIWMMPVTVLFKHIYLVRLGLPAPSENKRSIECIIYYCQHGNVNGAFSN